jgi:hypothetical protein
MFSHWHVPYTFLQRVTSDADTAQLMIVTPRQDNRNTKSQMMAVRGEAVSLAGAQRHEKGVTSGVHTIC